MPTIFVVLNYSLFKFNKTYKHAQLLHLQNERLWAGGDLAKMHLWGYRIL